MEVQYINGEEFPLTPEELAELDAHQASVSEALSNPINWPLEPYQFEAMLEIAGKTEAVKAVLASIEDPVDRAVANAKMARSTLFRREDPLVGVLSAAVGMTEEEVDGLWMQAKEL